MLLWLLLFVHAGGARAGVDFCDQTVFPSCLRDFQACEFDFDYGSTGGALLLGAVHVFGHGTIPNPDLEAQTGLSLDCSVTGLGTDLVVVRTRIGNPTASTAGQVRVFAFVNPNGNTFTSSQFLYDVPGVSFGAVAPGEPSFYGIDDLANLDASTPGNIDFEIFGAGLTNSNYCGAFCDVVFALQWSVGDLAPGTAAQITLGLSDTGVLASGRYLTAARANDSGVPDDPTTILTFSGHSAIVPLLATVPALSPWGISAVLAAIVGGGAVGLRRKDRSG